MYQRCSSLFAIGCLFVSLSSLSAKERIIFDTDIGGDIDDVGAMAVLHALMDLGEIELIGIGIVNGNRNCVPFVDAVNTFFGRPHIPIGTIKGSGPHKDRDKYLKPIVKRYPHDLTKEKAPEVVSFYRMVLAQSPDQSVTMVVVGQCTNISRLLDSGPDQYSSLSGIELMRKKVKFYAACGNGDGKLPTGRCGHNYRTDIASAANELAKLPSEFPTVFAGGSGFDIKLGNDLHSLPKDDIVLRAYHEYFDGGNLDRPCWDQLRVLYAARPAARALFHLSEPGDIYVSEETIHWKPEPNRNRAYAYARDHSAVRAMLNKLMLYRSPALAR